MISLAAKNCYVPIIIGIDYTYNKKFGIYRQALYQLILQAKRSKKQTIKLGFSATIEKQKFGIKPADTFAYMHTKDSYNMETLSALPAMANKLN